jgi:peptidoglycan/xylan/chitin deacetylase (PgdA/CDA1 family)
VLTTDELRSARLLFAAERAEGLVGDEDLDRPEVARAVTARPVPSRPSRLLQSRAMKRGRLGVLADGLEPMAAARRAVLGAGAGEAPPRLLVRVDGFPCADEDHGTEAFRRLHAIMAGAEVPYLVAVLPCPAHAPLDPKATGRRGLDDAEVEMLATLRRDGVEFAAHGLDHRTRHARPARRSELTGLRPRALRALLDEAERELAAVAVAPRVLVAPYDRFGRHEYRELARRYDVVCGGPRSVALMGFHPTPLWRGRAVYLPSYPPLHARAGDVLRCVQEHAGDWSGLWVPVVLRWAQEADDGWRDLERLVAHIAAVASPWAAWLDAVQRSR